MSNLRRVQRFWPLVGEVAKLPGWTYRQTQIDRGWRAPRPDPVRPNSSWLPSSSRPCFSSSQLGSWSCLAIAEIDPSQASCTPKKCMMRYCALNGFPEPDTREASLKFAWRRRSDLPPSFPHPTRIAAAIFFRKWRPGAAHTPNGPAGSQWVSLGGFGEISRTDTRYGFVRRRFTCPASAGRACRVFAPAPGLSARRPGPRPHASARQACAGGMYRGFNGRRHGILSAPMHNGFVKPARMRAQPA